MADSLFPAHIMASAEASLVTNPGTCRCGALFETLLEQLGHECEPAHA